MARRPPPRSRSPRSRRTAAVLVALVVGAAILLRLVDLWADYLWFGALGYAEVFTTALWTRAVLAAGALVLAAGWLAGQVWLALRLAPPLAYQVRGLKWTVPAERIRRWVFWGGLAFGLIGGLVSASAAAERWFDLLGCLHAEPFGWTDPVLGRDAAFYVFRLPVLEAVRGWILALAVAGGLGAVAAYAVAGAVGWRGIRMPRPAAVHLAALVALALLAVGAGYWLRRYALLLETGGTVIGAGYVDVHIRMPVLAAMALGCALAAAVVVAAGARGRPKTALLALAALAAVHVAAVWAYPSLRQRLDVEPNELVRETPFLAHHIAATRFAFGLDRVEEREFPVRPRPTAEDLAEAEDTLANIRLWDYRALRDTYTEIQALRTYYGFPNVGTDRYRLPARPDGAGGPYRQVSVAARELRLDALEEASRTWVNLHLVYTHGYGLCMSPVNEVTAGGMPALWVGDIPPRTTVPLQVTDPSIYFGEWTTGHVFVRTRQDEFHYPLKDENVYVQYEGRGGVPVDSAWRRLLFALYFGDSNILLTDSFTPETRVLWRRRVRERVRRLAPFLALDGSPYPVLHERRVVWILDAYTHTARFPYAAPARLGGPAAGRGGAGAPVNYVRNAVKVAVDARDGTVRFYVADPDDALVRTARRIFPGLFRDLAEMPADLRRHLRYPIDLFDVQAEQYFRYHMTDPQVFYNREDLWERPMEHAAHRPRPPQQHGGLDGRPVRPAARRLAGRLQVPERPARARSPAGRGQHRQERRHQPADHPVGPGRQPGHPRQPPGHSPAADRPLRRTALLGERTDTVSGTSAGHRGQRRPRGDAADAGRGPGGPDRPRAGRPRSRGASGRAPVRTGPGDGNDTGEPAAGGRPGRPRPRPLPRGPAAPPRGRLGRLRRGDARTGGRPPPHGRRGPTPSTRAPQ